MLLAYLTTDEVNWQLAQQLVEGNGTILYPLTFHDQPLDRPFDAVLYDWDHIPPDDRLAIFPKLLADGRTFRVALHAYGLDDGHAKALRSKGVAIFRRLDAGLFRDLVPVCETALTSAVVHRPPHVAAYNHKKQKYDAAVADRDAVLHLEPNHNALHNVKGLTYKGKKAYDEAIASYREAIHHNPDRATYNANRGLRSHDRADMNESITDSTTPIRLDPKKSSHDSKRAAAYDEIAENAADQARELLKRHVVTREALDKLLYRDTVLVFDTYIRGILAELEAAKDQAIRCAGNLEEKVAERTRELAELSRVDSLTGLLNKRAFVDEFRKEMVRAKRNCTPVAVVYFDVDGFKQINDTQGHQRGDEVLQAIGKEVQAIKREMDVACRCGGDEFCLILPNTDAEGARQFSQRFLRIEETAHIRLSIGISHTGPEHFASLDELLAQADDQMYAVKRTHNARTNRPS